MNLHITKSKNAESFYICKSYVKANGSTSSTIALQERKWLHGQKMKRK